MACDILIYLMAHTHMRSFLLGYLFLTFGCTLATSAHAATYYVAQKDGSNSNTGSQTSPFLTIQKCANVAVAGDTCIIGAGTYREIVTPAHSGSSGSPITFQPDADASVTISGANIVSGWSLDAGSVYKASVSPDLGRGYNQLFVDGQMVIEARYPNTSMSNILVPNDVSAQSVSTSGQIATVKSNALNQSSGFWNGATIVFDGGWSGQPHQPFSFLTGRVTASQSGELTVQFDYTYDRTPTEGEAINFYLVGTKNALDQSGEWALDNGALYLWTPASDNPSNHIVEWKARSVGFKLDGRSYITVKGLNFFAANVTTDNSSSHNLIDGINAKYVSHFTQADLVGAPGGGTGDPDNTHVTDTGIILSGDHNTLQNSTIVMSAGNGVTLWRGSNNTVTNNVIHDVGYALGSGVGTGLQVEDGGENSHADQVTYNTIYNGSRAGIDFTSEVGGAFLHNDIHDVMLRDNDGGAFYGSGTYDTNGTQIGYNLIHDLPDDRGSSFPRAGIYLDNSQGNMIVHHNVMWNISHAFWGGSRSGNPPASPNRYYNNTSLSSYGSTLIIANDTPSGNYEFRNNIFNSPLNFSQKQGIDTNNILSNDPGFVDAPNHNYQLTANSSAVDKGSVLSPWTDGYVESAPDIGAFEYGAQPWTAGANGTTGGSGDGGTPGSSCATLLLGSTIPQGFGTPWNVFNPSELLFKASCNGPQTTANLGPSTYIYYQGYALVNSQWQQISFTCTGGSLVANAWCPTSAQGTLPANATYYMGYTCNLTGTKWNCGCADTACAQSFWQLQKIN